MRTAMTVLLLILAIASPAFAADSLDVAITPIIDEGNAARNRGDWAAADSAFHRALDLATEKADVMWQYRAWFYLGLVKQTAAEKTEDESAKRALLEECRGPYRTAIDLNPNTKSARINLAEADRILGDHEAAARLLADAWAIDESPDVAWRLGNVQLDLGNRAEAARMYAIAAEKNPDSVTFHEKALTTLVGGDEPLGTALTAYLWALIQRKQIDRAIDAALRALEQQPRLSADDGRAVLTMLAAALAQKDYNDETFRQSAFAGRINELISAQSPHAAALRGLVEAYRGEFRDRRQFEPWHDDRAIGPPDTAYPLPIDAFRAVLRSIATALTHERKYESASDYYEFAVAFDKDRVDPGSVRGLASIYATRGDYEKLAKLDEQYSVPMSARTAATADSEDIYEYFRLMGRVHDSHGQTTPEERLKWLEQAKEAGTGGIAEGELYERIAEIYEERGNIAQSNSEKFSAAAVYMDRGNFDLARSAIADLGHEPEGVDQKSYERMIHRLIWFPDSIRKVVPASDIFTVKRNVLLLCGRAPREDQAKARAELKDRGITVDPRDSDLYVKKDGRVVRGHFFLKTAAWKDEDSDKSQ